MKTTKAEQIKAQKHKEAVQNQDLARRYEEILKTSKILQTHTTPEMRANSPNWPRLPSPKSVLAKLQSKGITLYMQENPGWFDPCLMTDHIKKMIEGIEGGLVPPAVVNRLMDLTNPYFFGCERGEFDLPLEIFGVLTYLRKRLLFTTLCRKRN
jgi:hypothetical protein